MSAQFVEMQIEAMRKEGGWNQVVVRCRESEWGVLLQRYVEEPVSADPEGNVETDDVVVAEVGWYGGTDLIAALADATGAVFRGVLASGESGSETE